MKIQFYFHFISCKSPNRQHYKLSMFQHPLRFPAILWQTSFIYRIYSTQVKCTFQLTVLTECSSTIVSLNRTCAPVWGITTIQHMCITVEISQLSDSRKMQGCAHHNKRLNYRLLTRTSYIFWNTLELAALECSCAHSVNLKTQASTRASVYMQFLH